MRRANSNPKKAVHVTGDATKKATVLKTRKAKTKKARKDESGRMWKDDRKEVARMARLVTLDHGDLPPEARVVRWVSKKNGITSAVHVVKGQESGRLVMKCGLQIDLRRVTPVHPGGRLCQGCITKAT